MRDYSPKDKTLAPLRRLGFTAGVIVPARGIIRGTSALVALSEENPNEAVIQPDVFQHIVFETQSSEERRLSRLADGGDRRRCGRASSTRTTMRSITPITRSIRQDRKRPEFNPSLEALAPAADKKMRVAFEPGSALMVDRAAQVSRELGLDFCLVSSGQEWRRPDLAKATGATFIVPVNFPALPKLPDESDWEQVSLDQLRAWDWAPGEPGVAPPARAARLRSPPTA